MSKPVIPLVHAPGVESIEGSSLLGQWLERLRTNAPRTTLDVVTVVAADNWGTAEPKMAYVHVRSTAPDGAARSDTGMLRGDTVNTLAIATCDGQEYAVFVTQPRAIGAQEEVVDNPAGRLDNGESFESAALRELDEELGVRLPWSHPIDMGMAVFGQELFLVSPGGTDERTKFMLVRANLTREQLHKLHDAFGGLEHEKERTKVRVVPLAEARRELSGSGNADLKLAFSLMLYNEYKAIQS